VAAASSRRVAVAVVTVVGVLFCTEGRALHSIVATCFVVELVAHVVDGESDSLSEV
jgi:hypothetical protein